MSRNTAHYSIFDGIAATKNSGLDAVSGKAYGILCTDYANAVISIATSGSANCTIKVKGAILNQYKSIQDIDFASATSRTNPWFYLESVNLNTGDPLTGSTGVVYTGTDAVYGREININEVDLIQFEITARSAGTINLDISLTGI